LSIDQSLIPKILKHIVVRRYDKIEVFDLEYEDSYIIDEEAFSVLRLIDGINSNKEIINNYTKDKQKEVIDALKQFFDLQIINFGSTKLRSGQTQSFNPCNIPEKNPFKEPYLRTLMINITEKCNLRCAHCYISEKHQMDYPFEKLKWVIEEFYRFQGLKLVLTGGEPFLYSKLKELLIFLHKIPLQKQILTNGVLIKDNLNLLNLIKKNFTEVYVSIDGLEETHNDIRNANCFQKTIEGIKILLENNIKVSINTMLHKQNLGEITQLGKFLKGLGPISKWIIDIPTFDNSMRQEVIEKYKITAEEAKPIFGKQGWGGGFEFEAENFACGPNIMAIDVEGIVTKCGFFTEQNVGNIFDLGLKKSWELLQKNLNWCLDELKCYEIGCQYLKSCRGGCRYRAFINTGDILGVDQYRCAQFDKK
jgi:radical SAM protein with 4Fe4S-binding SPASM domain